MKFDRKQHFSLRKYKSAGLASAVVGLSMLGATGALDNVPVLNNLFAAETVYAYTPSEDGEVVAYYRGRYVGTVHYHVDVTGNIHYDLREGWTINGTPTEGRYGPIELATYPEEGSGTSDSNTNSKPKPSTPAPPAHYDTGTTYDSSEGETIGTTPETYQADPTKPAGEKTLITQGKPARKRYHSDDGRTYRYVTDPAVPSVFSVGTKPKVVTEEIQPTKKRYVADKERERTPQNQNIEEKGQAGQKEVTTTYTLNETNGTVTPNAPTSRVIKDPTPTVVKVAAKNKVETIQRGLQTVENETQNKQNNTSNRLFILSKLSTPTTFYAIIKLTKYHKTTSKQKKRGKLVYFPLSCTNLFESLF